MLEYFPELLLSSASPWSKKISAQLQDTSLDKIDKFFRCISWPLVAKFMLDERCKHFIKKKILLHFFISIGAYTLLALHAALMPPETTYEHIATHIPTLREHNYTWQRLQFAEWLPTLCCSLIVSKRAMLDDLRQKCCRAFWNCEARVLCVVCRLVLFAGADAWLWQRCKDWITVNK